MYKGTPKKVKGRKKIASLDVSVEVNVHDLSLISEGNVPDLVSPFAICASAKDTVELFVSDVRLGEIFSISGVVDEAETNCVGK